MTKAGIFLAAFYSGKITVKEGTFTGKKGYAWCDGSDSEYEEEKGTISIKGGTFNVKTEEYELPTF